MISAYKARRLTCKVRKKIAIIFKNRYSFSLGKIDDSIKYAANKGRYETKVYIYGSIDREDMDNLIEYYTKRGYVVIAENKSDLSSITLNWEPRYEGI